MEDQDQALNNTSGFYRIIANYKLLRFTVQEDLKYRKVNTYNSKSKIFITNNDQGPLNEISE